MAFLRDLRYAARALGASPGFSVAAILTMAVGVGATAAIFAVVNAVLLRPLPFPDADRLVAVGATRRDTPGRVGTVSLEDLRDWRRQSRTVVAFAAWRTWGMSRYDDPNEKSVYAAIVTPDIFQVLPTRPVLGRLFHPADDTPGQNRLVVLTYDYWRNRFGADPGAIGKTLVLEREDKATYTIVGVLPPQFTELPSFDGIKLFALSSTDPGAATGREHRNRLVFARLRKGASIGQTRAEMRLIADRLARQYPTNAGWTASVRPLVDHEVGPMADTLRAFFAAVGFVLLIACANVAALQLARTLARRREFSIRKALGGSQLAIVRGVVAESLLLSLLGGAAGLLGARWLVELVVSGGPAIPRIDAMQFDAAVFAFAFGVCLGAGVLTASPATLLLTRMDPAQALKEESGHVASTPALRARMAFVAAQLALAVMLLSGAVVAGQTFVHQLALRPGFDPTGLASVQVFASLEKYKTGEQMTTLLGRLIDESRALPGITSVSAVSALPTSGEGSEPVEFATGDRTGTSPERLAANSFNAAPGYFRTLGIPIRRGRDFTQADTRAAAGVAIVNDSFVRRYLPAGADPLRQRIRLAGSGDVLTIVGVVGDVLQELKPRAAAEPEIYWPYTQRARWAAFLVVRGSNPGTSIAAVRARAAAIDPDLVIGAPRIMDEAIRRSSRGPRFLLLLFGLFAGVAALLSAIGVYGLVSYTSAQRTREIGVRISLGAGPRQIFGLVAAGGFAAVAAGSAVGLVLTLALTRAIAAVLPQMEPLRAAAGIVAWMLLVALGCVACYLPARRALRVDPVNALRIP